MPMPLAAWIVCNTFLRYLLEKVRIYINGRKFLRVAFVKFVFFKKIYRKDLLKYGPNCINWIVEVSYKLNIPIKYLVKKKGRGIQKVSLN